ncbi:MAG TPA: LLM class flavin-dependent oxidoreductase [Cerasibacillus sp.]|uniref:LLM class flavin-dependent oxidoreductase n=1 Tax=Cerasibacillus sp. TaxID=2498711 RepID=UPI002F3EEF81
MKLSILDQVPFSEGASQQEALHQTIQLAKYAERLGYERYWIAEHHDLPGLTCPAPDVLLSRLGAETNKIRIGAGAVLLPHYRPFNIAERYNLLATLYPGRIDLGIGRAPGGSAEATLALSERYLEKVRQYPELIDELRQFLTNGFPLDHNFSNVTTRPVPPTQPKMWLLGTSDKSAQLAVEKRLPYSFAHFMSDSNGPQIVQSYKKAWEETYPNERPYVVLAVSAICAETEQEAEELALSQALWQVSQDSPIPSTEKARQHQFTEQQKEMVKKSRKKQIIGNPEQVVKELLKLKEVYDADEIMILTITHSYEARKRSYELIANTING